MPKKAKKSSAKTKTPVKSKSQERREQAMSSGTPRTSAMARQDYENGKLADREIFRLFYPNMAVSMVGYGVLMNEQLYTKQREVAAGQDKEEIAVLAREDLESFLATFSKTQD